MTYKPPNVRNSDKSVAPVWRLSGNLRAIAGRDRGIYNHESCGGFRPAVRDYRKAVIGLFAETDPLVLTLPKLSPEPGATPDPVTASISWDATHQKAKITWTASTDPNLSHYEIRFCAGANYSTDNESTLGTITPSEPREFLTDAGLVTPGDIASFKVYVVLTTSNEKGSNTVTITRP